MNALILLGHGARDPAWAEPLQRLQALLKTDNPALVIETAFLEFMVPTLEDAAARLVASGAKRIVIAPIFLAGSGHVKRDLPEKIEQFRQRFPDCVWQLGAVAGEAPEVISAIAKHVGGLFGASVS